MKKTLLALLIQLALFPICYARTLKEQSDTKTLTFQLEGKKYDHLFLIARSFPLNLNNYIEIPIEGQTKDGYNWTFLIPDSLNNLGMSLLVKSHLFDNKSKIDSRFCFSGISGRDTLDVGCLFYDKKMSVIRVKYTKTTTGLLENFVSKDTLLSNVTICNDHFLVISDYKDSELELSMRYHSFGCMQDENYEKKLAEYDSIAKRYPDSKILMSSLSCNWSDYKDLKDLKRIFNSFSEKNRLSYYGKEISDYISRVDKLIASKFDNILLPNSVTNKREPIILDTTKFNLIAFSSVGCVGCRKEIPILKNIYSDLKDKLEIVYVSLDTYKSVGYWNKLMAKNSIPWRSVFAANNAKMIEDKYKADSIPRTLLVYPDGTVEVLDIRQEKDRNRLYSLVPHKR